MFDIAWSELLIIAAIAIVVVGPKDLPKMMRVLGRFVGHARTMASEFRSSLDQLAREAELDELHKTTDEIKKFKPGRVFEQAIDPDGSLKRQMEGKARTKADEGRKTDAGQKTGGDDKSS